MAFFKNFMARFRDWHEANKRGQRRKEPWGVRGRVYEKRPEPPPRPPAPTPGSGISQVEAIMHMTIYKENGDRIYVSRRATGAN